MKRVLMCLLAAVLAVSGCAGPSIPARPDSLGYEDIEFSIPQAEEWELPNGLKVFYYFNDELPQMRGVMYFPGGALYEETGIAGLSSAAGSQMREGGITGYPPEELDKHLDDMAASIESGFGSEYGSVRFFSLSEDFDEVFSLFSQVVRKPSFDPARLQLWKSLAAEGIRRRRDKPGKMAGMAFRDLVYGDDTPYSRSATYESVNQVTPERMREFHKRYVRPDGALFAITGSLPEERVRRSIAEHFSDWTPGDAPLPELPEPGKQGQPGIYVLERDFDQATIIIGHRGPPLHTPEQYGMKVYNQVFGAGGFSSVLFQEIRSRLGLAYSVYGGLWPSIGAGTFQIVLQTRNEEAPRAIKRAIELARESTTTLPPKDTFESAKSSEERSFVFKFAEPDSIVDRAAFLELLDYPKDYDQNFLANMEKVDREQLVEVGRRWVQPEDFVIVVVGRVQAEQLAEAFAGEGLKVREMKFDIEPRIVGAAPPGFVGDSGR